MASPIVLTGLPSGYPVPGSFVEVQLAAGPASLGTGTYDVLFLGNKLSSGSATVDTVVYGPLSSVPLTSEADAIALFGAGSELHRMIRQFLKVNTVSQFYAVAVTESAGSAASRTFSVSAGPATGDGTLRIYVGSEFVDVAVASGASVSSVATAACTAINTQTHWPVTASPSTGDIVITAKQKGPRGNWIRVGNQLFGSTGLTVSNAAQSFMTGGTTADSNTAALATILPERHYYIVSAAEDATQFGALCTQVASQALPLTGIRQRCFAGSVDTLSNATTIAVGVNNARAELVHLAQCDWEPAVLAANQAAVIALQEIGLPFMTNFAGYGNSQATQSTWMVPAPRSGAAPSNSNLVSALNNGVTPIGVNRNKTTYLVDRITTRSLNGSVNDYRIRDAHKVTICDKYADELQVKYAAQFGQKAIANDPPQGARVPGSGVVTPRVLKAAVDQLTRDFGNFDLLENVDTIIANTIVQRETVPSTRMGVRVPLFTIDNLKQIATAVAQVS